MTLLRVCLIRCSAIGNEFVITCSRLAVRKCTIWNVVVPAFMMMESPSAQSATAASAMARFFSTLTASLTLNGRPAMPTKLRRMQRFGAAAHAPEPSLNMQCGDVAPDRRLGGRRHLDELSDGRDRPLLHSVQDELMALALVHILPRMPRS